MPAARSCSRCHSSTMGTDVVLPNKARVETTRAQLSVAGLVTGHGTAAAEPVHERYHTGASGE